MEFIKKYLLLLFLIANTTAEYILFMSVSKMLFYSLMCISIPLVLSNYVFSSDTIRKCPQIYILGLILFSYQILFDLNGSSNSYIYLVAKLATFSIMMLSISSNFFFYFKETIKPFSYIILAFLILGFLFHPVNASGQYIFGFVNRNASCTLASIGLAGILFSSEKLSIFNNICMILLFVVVLMGGSRNSLAMCCIFIFMRYGFSAKLLGVSLLSVIAIMYIFPIFGIQINAFDRLIGTITGEVSLDRETEREATLFMITEKPLSGWGLDSKVQGDALFISEFGAHNGYLTFIRYMGYPFGLTFIITLFIGVIKRLRLLYLHDNVTNYHLAVMSAILFGANQEDYLVGVNQITTNIFFVSFVVSGFLLFYYKNNQLGFILESSKG